MTNNQQQEHQVKQAQVTKAEPFILFGFTFASKSVIIQFILTSLLVIFVPIAIVIGIRQYLKDAVGMSDLQKTAYMVIPAVVWMNVVIGIYIYRVIKDPQNYKRDPPIVVRPKRE